VNGSTRRNGATEIILGEEILARARAATDRKAFSEAIVLLRPLAESGDREAQFTLGFLVLTECEELTGREGFHWLLAAAEQGHAQAAFHVAGYPDFLSEGFTSPLSTEESWRFLMRAAEGGCVEAQYSAGEWLATGEWGNDAAKTVDLAAALRWYQRAADAGHATAQWEVGCMLLNGEGCDPDIERGIDWLKRAAASGDPQAPQFLAALGEGAVNDV
jgi:TPR repeat protein